MGERVVAGEEPDWRARHQGEVLGRLARAGLKDIRLAVYLTQASFGPRVSPRPERRSWLLIHGLLERTGLGSSQLDPEDDNDRPCA